MSGRRVNVFGPAYLDRVVRVDRPLLPGGGDPVDQSVEAEGKFGEGGAIAVVAPGGFTLEIEPPPGWPGPRGGIRLRSDVREGLSGRRRVRGIDWRDDLGGMGAGYAAALGGELHSALGPSDDPNGGAIAELVARYGIRHLPIVVPDHPSDWTLLVTSGEHGDKLPIGFRGCHAALDAGQLADRARSSADLLVVAALPNRLVEAILHASAAPVRFFAPAPRNMLDRRDPISRFVDRIDVLSCNREEWRTLDLPEAVASRIPIVAITDGPRGAEIRFRDDGGKARRIERPAFPRDHPPRDTNRAGEAFASTLLATLLDRGWPVDGMSVDESLMRMAAHRAAVASALVLDRIDFGFPAVEEIDRASQAGRVARPDRSRW